MCEWFLFAFLGCFFFSVVALAPFHRAACTVSAISFVSFLAANALLERKHSIQFFHLRTIIIKNNLHLLFFAFVCSLLLFSTLCGLFFHSLCVYLFADFYLFVFATASAIAADAVAEPVAEGADEQPLF